MKNPQNPVNVVYGCPLELLVLFLEIVTLLSFDENYEKIIMPSLCLCAKLCLIQPQKWQIHILIFVLAQFLLNFYQVIFIFFDTKLVCFWISAIRSVTNGCLLILFLPMCFKKRSQSISSQINNEKNSGRKFSYDHNSANLFSKLSFSWILPMYRRGYKTQIDVDMLEKISDHEKSSDHYNNFKKYCSDPKQHLFKPCLQMNIYLILFGAAFRLFADICSLGCALSIKWIVKSVNNPTNNSYIQIQNVTVEELILSPYIVMCGILILGTIHIVRDHYLRPLTPPHLNWVKMDCKFVHKLRRQ